VADDVKAGIARMYDEMSSTYNQIVPFHTYFGERLVAAAGVGEGGHVLDVATGQGACLIPAAGAAGATGSVVGIDLSREMLDVLNRSIAASGLDHVRTEVMDAEALQFDDRSFDVMTCAFALFFFPDRPRALAELVRVLRDGGTVAFSTFANDSLGYPWFSEVVAPFLPDDGIPPDAARRFLHVDTDGFHRQLQRAGCEEPVSEVVDARFHFGSADEHWTWLMSNGHRNTIERIDAAQIEPFKVALTQRLEEHRDEQGYAFDRPVRFTIARRAA
jgi:ubiquinone/menaquinone biosynthesis C-methylase UbiE